MNDFETIAAAAPCPFCNARLEWTGPGLSMHPVHGADKPWCQLAGMTVVLDKMEFWNRRQPPAASGEAVAWQSRHRHSQGRSWSEWVESDQESYESWLAKPQATWEFRALYTRPATVTDEDVERAARLIAINDGWAQWDTATTFNDTLSGNSPDEERDRYRDLATIALSSFANKEMK